jgi:hypothetical protein
VNQRPRIDLDGVALTDVDNPLMPLAAFRYRTQEGLLFQIPESGELLVKWADIEGAKLDLDSGKIEVVFRPAFVSHQPWLRGARTVTGDWLDRYKR